MAKLKESPIKQIQKLHNNFQKLIGREIEVEDFNKIKMQFIVNKANYIKDKNGLPFVLVQYKSLSNSKFTSYDKIAIYNYKGKMVAYLNYQIYPNYNYIKMVETDNKYRGRHLATQMLEFVENYTKKNFVDKDITLICLHDDSKRSNINSNLPFYSNLNYKACSENFRPGDTFIEMYKEYDDLKTYSKSSNYKQKGRKFVKEK